MSAHTYIVTALPAKPPGELPRFGAKVGFSAGISYIEFDPALSRVAIDMVERRGVDNRDWYVETRDQFFFSVEANRDAFVALWNDQAC